MLTDLGEFFAEDVVQPFQSEQYMNYPQVAYASFPLCPYGAGREKRSGG